MLFCALFVVVLIMTKRGQPPPATTSFYFSRRCGIDADDAAYEFVNITDDAAMLPSMR